MNSVLSLVPSQTVCLPKGERDREFRHVFSRSFTMGRPLKWVSEENAALGVLPLRKHWQQIIRQERRSKAQKRAKRKARDRSRPTCQCKAYCWPHRPGGGMCRHPDPPLASYERNACRRPYRERYTGLRRQLARANGLHPIRDRGTIVAFLPGALRLAKVLKQKCPRVKYRNVEITENGVRGHWQTAGPTM